MTKTHTVAARDVAAILHLDAGHDTNGNPRRGYLVIGKREGWPIAYVDEGYRGIDALRDVIRSWDRVRNEYVPAGAGLKRRMPYPIHVATKPAELREWRGKVWA